MALKLKQKAQPEDEHKEFYTPNPLIVVLAREKRKKPLSWYYQVVASPTRGKRYAKVGYADWYSEDQLVIVKRFKIGP